MLLGLKERMKRKGYTYESLAIAIGMSDGNVVWRYASGLRKPNMEVTAKMAEILECTIEDLLNPPPAPAAGAKQKEPTVKRDRRKRIAAA